MYMSDINAVKCVAIGARQVGRGRKKMGVKTRDIYNVYGTVAYRWGWFVRGWGKLGEG